MANRSEFTAVENKVVDTTVARIKTDSESGVPGSILIPNYYFGPRPKEQRVDPHFSPYVQEFYQTLPEPEDLFPAPTAPDFVKYRIGYDMIFAIQEDLGKDSFQQQEEYATPFHIGEDSHFFYLTKLPRTVYHLFGWSKGKIIGGRLDLVTVNIDFEELLENSRRIRRRLREEFSW